MRLPYVPSPYPDEILGSWLARTALHNGSGTWRVLLEETGFGRRVSVSLFDTPDYSNQLQSLLLALGTEYEQAVYQLTTYPYWTAFDSIESAHAEPTEAVNLPTLVLGNGLRSTGMTGIGVWRGGGQVRRIRYCPTCFLDDFLEYGEVFWHRSHHLPNILFCPKHNCTLLYRCSHCGHANLSTGKFLTPTARLRCVCGRKLGAHTSGPRPSDTLLRLAELSLRAMHSGPPNWDRRQVRGFLRGLIGNHSYVSILSSAFGVRKEDDGLRLLRKDDVGATQLSMSFHQYFSGCRAPECCALLAALGISFDSAVHGFKAHCIDKPPLQKREIKPPREGSVKGPDAGRGSK
ncbi:TniQ family protein [Ralstonia pseudosolanacearum]|uniref:TniQ family protein n=1 Tax=Ralstonia pseudosolanacearum TaxID=1310165 RepID=UPI003AAC2126